MRFSRLLACLVATMLVLTGCDIVGQIGYSPPGIPVKVTVNSKGEVKLSASYSVATPIGTFSLGGGKTIHSIRQESDKRLLVVRVDGQVTIYELEEGEDFKVTFEGNKSLYRRVALEYESDGDIVLELESVPSAIDPNAVHDVTFRLNELTKKLEHDAVSGNPYYLVHLEIDGGKTHTFQGNTAFSKRLQTGHHTWKAKVEGWDGNTAFNAFEGNGTFEVYDDCEFWLETGYGTGLLDFADGLVVLKPN